MLALAEAPEGVVLNATFDAGPEIHMERLACVLDSSVINVVMGLPTGLDLEVHDAAGRCVDRQRTVTGQSLQVYFYLKSCSHRSYFILCEKVSDIHTGCNAALQW